MADNRNPNSIPTTSPINPTPVGNQPLPRPVSTPRAAAPNNYPTPAPSSMLPPKPQASTVNNPTAHPPTTPNSSPSSPNVSQVPTAQPVAANPLTPNPASPSKFSTTVTPSNPTLQSLPQPTPATVVTASATNHKNKRRSNKILIIIIIVTLLLLTGGYAAYRLLGVYGLLGNTPTSGSQQVNLTYWGLWEPESVMQPFIDEYQAANPHVTITYQNSSPIEYAQRLRSALEKDAGGPDIFRMHNTWTYMLNENLSTIPSTIYTKEEYQQIFYKIAYQNFLLGTELVAIPLEYDGLGLYYNVDLFNKAGVQPPTDWATFQSAARAIRAPKTGEISIAGAAIGSTKGIENWADIVGLLMYQNQASPITPTERVAHDALTFYGLFSYRYDVWNKSWPSATEQFALGKVGMMFGPSYRVFEIQKIAQDNNIDIDFRIIPVPQLPETNVTWASFWGEAVSKKSPHTEEAWKFIKFLSEKDTMRRMFAEQSKVREFGEPPSRRDLAEEFKNHPYIGAYLSQAEAAASFPLTMGTTDVDGINDRIIKAYEPAVESISTGTAPAGPLASVAKNINTILKGYGLAQ